MQCCHIDANPIEHVYDVVKQEIVDVLADKCAVAAWCGHVSMYRNLWEIFSSTLLIWHDEWRQFWRQYQDCQLGKFILKKIINHQFVGVTINIQNVHLYITVGVVVTHTRPVLSKVFVFYVCSGCNRIK